MRRISWPKHLSIWITVGMLLHASTGFSDPGEKFPQSSFGAPPARLDGTFAASEADEYDQGAGPSHGLFDRSPASMNFDSSSASSSSGTVRRELRPQPSAQDLTPETATSNPAEQGLSSLTSRDGVQEVAIIASDLGFFPRTVFVSRDVPVRMYVTGASKNTLCIMMESFQVRKEVRSQKIEEITFTPSMPGKYRFYCPVNGMEGTMIVKEFSTSAPSSRSAVARVPANDVLN